MELETKINLSGFYIIAILSNVTQKEFYGKEWNFVYGQNELTDDMKLITKQLKRVFKR